VSYVRLWTANDDPYSPIGNSIGEYMALFKNEWNTNMADEDRHMAHLLSGRSFSDALGLAKENSLCDMTEAYALSGDIQGWFPMPLEDENEYNQDPILFAHETGHVFGMMHTHDIRWSTTEPTIDEDNPDLCGNGDCDNASGATIMSYCQQCGGWANIVMEFDEKNVERASIYISGQACDFEGVDPTPPPIINDDHAVTDIDTPVAIHVLDNDIPNDCNYALSLLGFDERGTRGGFITRVMSNDDPPVPTDVLLYTPTGYITGNDSFTYTARDTNDNWGIGNVVVQITRPPPGGGGGVNPNDVIFVITLWGTRGADVNGDGVTDVKDLLEVLSGDAKPVR